jgi:peptidoglycan/xylan/chitin deacetylase (PgdA/CDA1 family)
MAPAWAARQWAARSPGVEIGTGRILGKTGRPVDIISDVGAASGGDDDHDGDGTKLTPVYWLRGLALRAGGAPLRLPVLPAGLLGAPDRAVAEVTGDAAALAEVTGQAVGLAADAHDLPEPPSADVTVARLRRAGATVRWTDPVVLPGRAALVRRARSEGRAAVAAVRPDELALSRVGSWWQGTVGQRILRRLPGAHLLPLPGGRLEDVAFWQGVRKGGSTDRWAALTGSYVCLMYHRVSGEMRPGQERYDVAPHRFARNAAILRILGWRPLYPAELVSFHRGSGMRVRRRFVVTLDDGYPDAVAAAASTAHLRPHLYVPTAEVGSRPAWTAGVPLAGWTALAAACAAGVLVGAHGRVHRPLTELPADQVVAELATALSDLRSRLPDAIPILAYPNGQHDHATREAAVASGYSAAWTTMTGRNGAALDPYCLRRVSIKDWDGPLSFLWKLTTGQNVPPLVEIVNRWRWKRRGARREARRARIPR